MVWYALSADAVVGGTEYESTALLLVLDSVLWGMKKGIEDEEKRRGERKGKGGTRTSDAGEGGLEHGGDVGVVGGATDGDLGGGGAGGAASGGLDVKGGAELSSGQNLEGSGVLSLHFPLVSCLSSLGQCSHRHHRHHDHHHRRGLHLVLSCFAVVSWVCGHRGSSVWAKVLG